MDASNHSPRLKGTGSEPDRDSGVEDPAWRGACPLSPPAKGRRNWWAWARGPAGVPADGLRLRRWFVSFLLWLGLLTVVALASFARYEHGTPAAQDVWLMCIALFYLSLCCAFFPAPTAWIVMLLASGEVGLIQSVPLRALVVAGACAFATAMANLNEYHLITFILRYGRVARLRRTHAYQVAARWFETAPFMVIAVIAVLPIPVDVVRWLAIVDRYSRWRFFLAYLLGRSGRYGLLAASAVWLELRWWEIVLIQVALVLLAGLKILRTFLRNRGRTPAPAKSTAVVPESP